MKIDILELRTPDDEQTIQDWIDTTPPATINFISFNGNYVYIFYTEIA
jgi:hypothetical protein